jgi:hypothetical protein
LTRVTPYDVLTSSRIDWVHITQTKS